MNSTVLFAAALAAVSTHLAVWPALFPKQAAREDRDRLDRIFGECPENEAHASMFVSWQVAIWTVVASASWVWLVWALTRA